MIGKVTEWKMTEEKRQAYIALHPIKRTGSEKKRSSSISHIDYKWRGKKATEQNGKKKA